MSSSTTPMLSDSALRSDEIPDGYLSLDEKVLTYILHDSAPQQINLVDCVGASAESCTLVVSFMPIAGGGGWGCRKLRREFVVQRFLCHTRTQASKWAEALWRVVNGMAPDGAAPPRKRWLILINPVSGPGNAVRIFGQVRPVLAANRVALTELVTTHAGHAAEIAAGINLDDVDGIVCVGGDGLLHELVNGLMVRPDASAAVAQLHLGVLPGGSANSLCTSLVCTFSPARSTLSARCRTELHQFHTKAPSLLSLTLTHSSARLSLDAWRFLTLFLLRHCTPSLSRLEKATEALGSSLSTSLLPPPSGLQLQLLPQTSNALSQMRHPFPFSLTARLPTPHLFARESL